MGRHLEQMLPHRARRQAPRASLGTAWTRQAFDWNPSPETQAQPCELGALFPSEESEESSPEGAGPPSAQPAWCGARTQGATLTALSVGVRKLRRLGFPVGAVSRRSVF